MEDRTLWIYKAKLSEQVERFDEMITWMKEIAKQNVELTIEERNLLSVAYKNVIGSRRSSWRTVVAIEQKERLKEKDSKVDIIQEYREKIEKEMNGICNDILTILEENLIPNAESGESKVFFQKMKGDYYRYLAEYNSEPARTGHSDSSLASYQKATELASLEMSPTNPIRLGLALNFSVFYYEILNSTEKACALAKGAFDEAIAELDTLAEESYKDSTLIMQLLRDNLTLWTSDEIVGVGEAHPEPDQQEQQQEVVDEPTDNPVEVEAGVA